MIAKRLINLAVTVATIAVVMTVVMTVMMTGPAHGNGVAGTDRSVPVNVVTLKRDAAVGVALELGTAKNAAALPLRAALQGKSAIAAPAAALRGRRAIAC